MFKIMGEYNGKKEEIDTANSESAAEYLMYEYALAFGKGWKIWIEKED